ncbi:MAG: NnrS family protein [Beijerinckiaceae bacterium]
MTIAADHLARCPKQAWLTQGFRPFFLAAGAWSAAALALWIVLLSTGIALPSRFDSLTWHIHEMLFGFVMASVAGFLLTAVPNWTKRLPVRGLPLAILVGLWLVGRIACLVSALVPAWLAIAADLAFPAALVAVTAREIAAGRNWRNLPMVAPVTVLGIANLLMHLEASGLDLPAGLGWRLGLAAVAVLISVIGGRIVPSFTRNWLAKRQEAELPTPHGAIDRAALGVLHAGLFGWAFVPELRPLGLVLLLAAALNLWRLVRWRGDATLAEPLLIILHLGYAWLVVGTALLGLSTLGADVAPSAAIHALTTGAIGTMILAVMTRATRGHTGRDLSADRSTTLIYTLVTLAAVTRVAAAFGEAWMMPLLVVSACLWIAAFGLFTLAYGPMLVLPPPRRLRPVPET